MKRAHGTMGKEVSRKIWDMQQKTNVVRAISSYVNGDLRNWYSTLMLLSLIVIFYIATPRFLTLGNAQVILEQSVVLAVAAFGATLVIIAGCIDLSVGSTVGLAAVTAALMINGFGVVTGVAMAVVAGAAVGSINGGVFSYGKIPSFIVTLGTLTAVRGVVLGITGGSPTVIEDEGFVNFVNGRSFGVAHSVVIAVITGLAAYMLLERFAFGREVRAIGGGERVAHLSGLNVDRVKMLVFVVAGLLAGVGGVLLAARSRVGDPTQGVGLELQVIAAVVIGGTPLTGGIGRIWGTAIGAVTIGVLSNGLNILGVEAYWQDIVTGLVLVLAVFLTIDRHKIGIIK
jgi:ribose transport system permease protein